MIEPTPGQLWLRYLTGKLEQVHDVYGVWVRVGKRTLDRETFFMEYAWGGPTLVL